MKNIPKDTLEVHVVWLLRDLLEDEENLVSLAVDIASYYKNLYAYNGYIASLESELKETERGINNLIKVIEKGVLLDAVTNRLTELENKKTGIEEAIETEKLKQALVEDENYSFFILKEDGTLTWECPESGVKTEQADENTDFSQYYNIGHLCPECCED